MIFRACGIPKEPTTSHSGHPYLRRVSKYGTYGTSQKKEAFVGVLVTAKAPALVLVTITKRDCAWLTQSSDGLEEDDEGRIYSPFGRARLGVMLFDTLERYCRQSELCCVVLNVLITNHLC